MALKPVLVIIVRCAHSVVQAAEILNRLSVDVLAEGSLHVDTSKEMTKPTADKALADADLLVHHRAGSYASDRILGREASRRQAFVDECMDHTSLVVQVSSTPSELHRALGDLCDAEFLKIEARVTTEVGVPQATASLAKKCCQSGLRAIVNATDMNTIGKQFCSALASTLYSSSTSLLEDNVGGTASTDLSAFCFPEDATVTVRTARASRRGNRTHPAGVHSMSLQDVRPGDYIQSADMASGETFFTPMLADLHSDEEHRKTNLDYLMLRYEGGGSLNLTAEHALAIEGRGMVPAFTVRIGDRLLTGSGGHVAFAEIQEIRHVVKRGMYAPLTSSGMLLVNGVLVSSYVAPSPAWGKTAWDHAVSLIGWDGAFRIGHFCMLPVRLAHVFGLPEVLERLAFIPGATSLKCLLSPCAENGAASLTGSHLPRYADRLLFCGPIGTLCGPLCHMIC